MRQAFLVVCLLWLCSAILAVPVFAQSSSEWYMAGANPERNSWVSEEVPGLLKAEWFKPFDAYILPRIQVITAHDMLYISTSNGLYAIDANTGDQRWVYPTELPLGHSPTIDGNTAYVGGFDKKLHAIDALTGQGLWTFDGQQGFQTNPLVVGGIVYAGSRDSYMYAIDANSGQEVWKFKTNGPVLFSAAYSNGHIYFASNDMHAYALDANTGAQVWKSTKLPGNGFHSWWPVVYRNYVIFAGSMGYRRPDGYDVEKPDIFPDFWYLPQGTMVGPEGKEPGDWVANTPTLDLSKPNLVPEGTSHAVTQYYEQKPWRRSMFILDKTTGNEITYDFDNDGNPEYAPLTWHGQHGGNRYPPIVGGDGVLYQSTVYRSDQWIMHGHIVGWKVNTPFISQISAAMTPSDETLAYSAGGNLIYFNEFFDRQGASIDISHPLPDTSFHKTGVERWYHNHNLKNLTTREYSRYWPLGAPMHPRTVYGATDATNGAGAYGLHGDFAPPIPYKGKVYSLNGNSLFAFSLNGTNGDVGIAPATVQSASSVTLLPTKSDLQQKLEAEIQKILNAGHLQPGYVPSGSFEWASYFLGCGDYMHDYWHHPADTVQTLLSALPHLPPQMQTDLRAYIQNEYTDYPPYKYNHIGWTSGAQREIADRKPDSTSFPSEDKLNFGPITREFGYIWPFSPHAYYSLYKYAQEFGNADQILQLAESSTLHGGLINVASDSDLILMPHAHNSYIAGYYGYLNLAQLAGRAEDPAIRAELDRLLQLRSQNFGLGTQYDTFDFCRSITTSRNFMFMVPELADYLRNNNQADVQAALNEYYRIAPYWFVSKVEVGFSESTIRNLFDYHALFQAKSQILQEPYEELAKYIDVPAVETGDLFYIQNLVSAIEAPSLGGSPTPPPSPTQPVIPGDQDGDHDVDIFDYLLLITNFPISTIFDFNSLLQNI